MTGSRGPEVPPDPGSLSRSDAVRPPPRSFLRPLALLLWGVFLVAESAFRLLDLYFTFPLIDVPSHFLAGGALAATALWALAPLGPPRIWLLAVAAVLAVGLAWEAGEIVDEMITPDPPPLRDPFIWDGVIDVLVSTASGALLVEWVRRVMPTRW